MEKPARNGAMSPETLLPLMAAHVLQHGLAGLSLRPLAKAARTSDRMLLYHFGTKDRLVAELLDYLARMFAAALDGAFPPGRCASRRACYEQVMAVTAQPEFAPFFRLWWDIVAGCSRGDRAYVDSASAIVEALLEWLRDHLPLEDPNPAEGARHLLTLIEGGQMLTIVGRPDLLEGIADSID